MDKNFIVQVRFNPEDIQFITMKTMDRQARLAMMPDYEMYCVHLKESNLQYSITRNNGISTPELDGTNCLQFYYIDLFESVCRVIQDPTYASKLYHAFELQTDSRGD